MSLLTVLIVKNSHISAGIYLIFLKKRPRPNLKGLQYLNPIKFRAPIIFAGSISAPLIFAQLNNSFPQKIKFNNFFFPNEPRFLCHKVILKETTCLSYFFLKTHQLRVRQIGNFFEKWKQKSTLKTPAREI